MSELRNGVPDDTPVPDYEAYAGNTSATGGFLAPMEPAPNDDQALDVDVQRTVAGVTGLPLSRVVPRWQPKPPPQPEIDVSWCAVGVISSFASYRPAIIHVSDAGGYDVLMTHEVLDVLLSFYGPAASGYAKRLRDGLQVWQNRAAMRALGLALVETGRMTTLPAVVGQQWQRRVDVELTLRRQVTRTYAVQNLVGASGTIEQDGQAATPGEGHQTTSWITDADTGTTHR